MFQLPNFISILALGLSDVFPTVRIGSQIDYTVVSAC